MSKKLTIIIFFIVSLVITTWSTNVVAQENRESQIEQVKEQMKELEYALEREHNEEKAAKLKGNLQEYRNKLEQLMSEGRRTKKSEEKFSEIQLEIRRTKGNMEELRAGIRALKEEDGNPKKLRELQDKLVREERKLVELNELLKKREASARQERRKPQTRLMFFPLEHGNAQNLGSIIQRFLTPSGIVMWDLDTNTLVIKATDNDLEIASAIVENLDIPKRKTTRDQARRREVQSDRDRQESFFFGEVLKAGRESLTIRTMDSREKVTLYVPFREKDDGTRVLYEELSMHVASFDVGTNVRVQWRQGEDRRYIQRVTDIKKEVQRREREARWKVFFGKVLKSSEKSITIKTMDSGEEVTLYVPPRRRDDGKMVPNKELAVHVASFDVGTGVKVQWEQGEEKRLIRRITRIKE